MCKLSEIFTSIVVGMKNQIIRNCLIKCLKIKPSLKSIKIHSYLQTCLLGKTFSNLSILQNRKLLDKILQKGKKEGKWKKS